MGTASTNVSLQYRSVTLRTSSHADALTRTNMDPETIRTAVEAEGNERINCPVCGESIPAFELGSDHAHTTELLEALANQLTEGTDEERLEEEYGEHTDRNPETEDDDPLAGFGAWSDTTIDESVREVGGSSWNSGSVPDPNEFKARDQNADSMANRRAALSHTLATNGFSGVLVLSRERIHDLDDMDRLAVADALQSEPLTKPEIADRTGLSESEVDEHLSVLNTLGIARADGDGYYLPHNHVVIGPL